jgi:hypothetical protein
VNGVFSRRPTAARFKRARLALGLTLAVVLGQQLWHLLGVALMGGMVSADVNWGYYDAMAIVGSVVAVSAIIVTGVFFIQWERSMTHNLLALGDIDVRVSVAEVTWGWFVPLVNLVYPYLGMRQIARLSAPPGCRPAYLLVGLWWGTWIGAGVLGRVAWLMTRIDLTPMGWINAAVVSVLAGATSLLCGALALRLLTRFTAEQDARFAAIAEEA